MEAFNYTSPGDLYFLKGSPFRRRAQVSYRRFNSAAEALRFAIEAMPAPILQGCFMEVEGEQYEADQMRELYESAQYPLPRLEA